MKVYISELISQAIKQISPGEADTVLGGGNFDVSYPKAEFGDYATNAAMVLFKQFNVAPADNPMEFAKKLAETMKQLDHKETFSKIESTGGFINFTLSEKFLVNRLQEILKQGEYYGRSDFGENRKVIVEYFQNNIAKPPHVGHLRSAVIGDSLMRILKFLNFDVMSDTHVGDWGTQFGILLYAYKTLGKKEIVEKDPIQELNKLYVEMSAKIEQDPELREKGKAEFAKLEAGDKENRELWEWFVKVSMEDFERYRQLLDLKEFDHNLGESFYEDQMAEVLKLFENKGLVTVGETGEKYVDLEDQGLGRCILVKSDGATTYHLRDFATYIYRKNKFDFYRNLYIVDVRQSHHFRQLFRVLEMAGFPAETDSAHLDFGFMSLPEGAISTRKGNVISLENLIGEAEKLALAIIQEKNPELENKENVAKQVARAAIKYFDLSHNRKTEIVFEWDKALSFEGNTGPYLQYTHARIHGILRKAYHPGDFVATPPQTGGENKNSPPFQGGVPSEARGGGLNEQERAVISKLNYFPEILEQIPNEYLPNILCNYLFELSQNFNAFYENNPVTQEEDSGKKALRINLVKATAQVLQTGLNLLGIDAPQRM